MSISFELIERKRRGLQQHRLHMLTVADKIRYRREPIDLRACHESLAEDHLVVGTFDFFISNESMSLKQNFHVATKLQLKAIELDNLGRFVLGSEIFNAMLSDNPSLIEAVAHLEPPDYLGARSNPLNSQFFVHMLQLALRGDYESLQGKVDRLGKNGRKADRQLPARGQDFFSLLMRGDKRGLEDLIAQHGRVRAADPLIETSCATGARWKPRFAGTRAYKCKSKLRCCQWV